MYKYQFPMAGNTATVAVFNARGELLIGKRWPSARAFPNFWCLPGGFLNAKCETFCGETIEVCALRELEEETSLVIDINQLNLFAVNSGPDTDPRGQVVNVCYFVQLDYNPVDLVAGDDVDMILWVDPCAVDAYDFAFNHGTQIIPEAIAARTKEQLIKQLNTY